MNISLRKHGFTLIELSIVLVIIGLIIGSVLVGRDLIYAATIRAQIKQIDELKVATNAFRLKYDSLPGDISSIKTVQLGFFTFTGPYAGRVSPYNATVNNSFGNDDGSVNARESYVFWQHLSEAGMIAGQYGGSVSAGYYIDNTTSGCPAGCMGGSIVGTCTAANGCYSAVAPAMKLAALFSDPRIGVGANRAYSGISAPAFNTHLNNFFNFRGTALQEFDIDTKMDDGLPLTGTVRETFGLSPIATCSPQNVNSYTINSGTSDTLQTFCSLTILW